MHEQEGILTALALGIALCGAPAAAQPEVAGSRSPAAQPPRDAAQKAREGDIGHWIDYYRSQAPGGVVPGQEQKPQPSPAASPADR